MQTGNQISARWREGDVCDSERDEQLNYIQKEWQNNRI